MSTTASYSWLHPNDIWASDRMVDDKPQSFPYHPDTCQCCAGTLEFTTIPAYVQLDLGSEYIVSMIQIISRTDIETYWDPDNGFLPRTGIANVMNLSNPDLRETYCFGVSLLSAIINGVIGPCCFTYEIHFRAGNFAKGVGF